MLIYQSARDPVNDTVTRPYQIRSTTKGGSGVNILGFEDLRVPASANFPPSQSGTATRYFIELPMDPYIENLVTYPFSARNETRATDLVRKDYGEVLTNYTYKLFPSTRSRRAIMEVHFGASSNRASDTISFDGYFVGSAINTEDLGVSFNIGAWNMDATASVNVTIPAPFDTQDALKRISGVDVIIRNNADTVRIPLDHGDVGGAPVGHSAGSWTLTIAGASVITLTRLAGGYFDTAGFNDAVMNRGWVTIRFRKEGLQV